jgi:hypothetical protein
VVGALVACCLFIAGVLSGCTHPFNNRASLNECQKPSDESFVFHSDDELPPCDTLIAELKSQRERLSRELGLSFPDKPIHIYVFRDENRWRAFQKKHYPERSKRRAFCNVYRPGEIYVQWTDRVAEDLRHEVTHACLHSVIPNIPLWLDEGLAEFFEVSHHCRGIQRIHIHTLVKQADSGDWQPNLRRLESMPGNTDLTAVDYAEAWAWTHWMLTDDSSRRETLRAYLAELREGQNAKPLSARIAVSDRDPGQELINHMLWLAVPFD